MSVRRLRDDEMQRFQAEISDIRNLAFPFVLLLDNGVIMRNLATSGSEHALILEGVSDRYYMGERDNLLVVETPHNPDWAGIRIVWEHSGPCAGSPATLSLVTDSGERWRKGADWIVLRKIPLRDGRASLAMISATIMRGMPPLVLKVPIPELGVAGVEVEVVVFNLMEGKPADTGEEEPDRIFGLTYSIGGRPLEVVFEFDEDNGCVMLHPFDDGGL